MVHRLAVATFTSSIKEAATLEFARFLTTPDMTAHWGIATGYVATRPDAWDTEAMKKYADGFPAALVARDQLKDALSSPRKQHISNKNREDLLRKNGQLR